MRAFLLAAVVASAVASGFHFPRSIKDLARNAVPGTPGPYSFLHRCRLREDPEVYLHQLLANQFAGQEEARSALVAAIKGWSDE